MQKNLPVLAAISFLLVIGAFSGCSETPTDPLPAPGDSASLASLYDERPNVDNCFEGRLKQAEREKVLAYVNAIRRLHGLEDVEYRAADDIQTAKASLIIAANSTLTHQPTASMRCYTQEGYDGSSTSNIGFRSGETPSSESFIDMWLVDNGVASLGHRRWIIDPFLRHISFGRVDRTVGGMFAASALKVIYAE